MQNELIGVSGASVRKLTKGNGERAGMIAVWGIVAFSVSLIGTLTVLATALPSL